jgi:hypothetical protein
MYHLIDTESFNESTDVIALSNLARVMQNTLCREERGLIYIIKTTE